MGPYRQDACRRPYQDLTPLKARGVDKAVEFGGYSTLDQLTPFAISVIFAISAIFVIFAICRFNYPTLCYSQVVSKFPILV